MKTILIVALTLGLAASSPSAPHKFEDGFVERTLAIVIRDNAATAEYSIALNQSTLNELLDQWKKEADSRQPEPSESTSAKTTAKLQSCDGSKSDTETETFIDPKPDSRIEISEPESTTQSSPKLHPKLHTKGGEDSQTERPQEQNRQAPEATSSPAATTSVAQPADESEEEKSLPHDDENPIHERLLAELKSIGPDQIAQRIQINCDGQPLKIKNVVASPAPRHPFNLKVKFEFELPPTKSAQLDIVDNNFRQQTGAVRYAIKALGSTMLVKSNAAPIIIRAKRVELAGLSEKETVSETSISAKILVMSNSDKDD